MDLNDHMRIHTRENRKAVQYVKKKNCSCAHHLKRHGKNSQQQDRSLIIIIRSKFEGIS